MKKKWNYLGLLLCMMVVFSGCSSNNDGGPQEPQPPQEPGPPEGAVALLINQPTEEDRQSFLPLGDLILQESQEGFIFVAIRESTDLEVVEIQMQEDGTLKEGKTLYRITDAPPGFALEIQAIRPEGAPSYKLLIRGGQSEQITYYISYNGKDGNPKEEYIYEK